MNAFLPLSVLDINTAIDTDPRVADVRLAEVLGFAHPRRVRSLIKRHGATLARFGEVCTTAVQTSKKGGRPGEASWLNEKQALYLCAKSDAPNAVEITIVMVEVFHAAITGGDLPAAVDHSDMLADLSHRTENALARLHEVTANEVGSVRGYLKTGVVAPLEAHHSYVEERFRNLHKRDKGFHHLLQSLVHQIGQVLALADRAVQPDAFIASEWADVADVYKMAGLKGPIPRQRSLSGAVTRSLDAFCKHNRRQIDMDVTSHGNHAAIWRRTAVRAWLASTGRALIDQHIAKHSGQTVIQFPGNPVEGGVK